MKTILTLKTTILVALTIGILNTANSQDATPPEIIVELLRLALKQHKKSPSLLQ